MKALKVVLPTMVTVLTATVYFSTAALNGKKPKNVFFSGIEISNEIINPGRTETVGNNKLLRGMVQRAQDITNDDRSKGELTIEANAYLDFSTNCGPMWGTFVLTNPGGKWLAAWIGQKTTQGTTIYAMGYGSGAYQNFMANWTYTRKGEDQSVPFSIKGFIISKA